MPYEQNKDAYQDDAYFERERRNILDVRNWNRDLMGQTFYQICQDNKNKYRTIQFKQLIGKTVRFIKQLINHLALLVK